MTLKLHKNNAIFSAKNISTLDFRCTRRLNETSTKDFVKLTTLWTTGPRLSSFESEDFYYSLFQQRFFNLCDSPVLKYRIGDWVDPGSNPALCNFSAFMDFFLFSECFDKKGWKQRKNVETIFWNTVFIPINAHSPVNAPSHFLWGKCGKMPPKNGFRTLECLYINFVLRMSFLGLKNCNAPRVFY